MVRLLSAFTTKLLKVNETSSEHTIMYIKYVDIVTMKFLSSVYVANIVFRYWSIHSSMSWGAHGVMS